MRINTESHGSDQPEGVDGHGKGHDFDLAIVGGGFSGVCTAWHVLTHKRVRPTFRCVIIEPGNRLGAGLAYRTDSPCHLLNVRARGMSITAADTRSFTRWLSEAAPEYRPDDFVPRGIYRRYLAACLDRARKQRSPDMLTVLKDKVNALTPQADSGYLLQLKSGDSLHVGSVVLALGNLPAKSSLDHDLLRSPWGEPLNYSAITSLAIVGAGLTALDVILEAEGSGYSGSYRVISPHGQFPRPHREPFLPVPSGLREWATELTSSQPSLRQALRAFQEKRKSGICWEHLVDALRGSAATIWSNFSRDDKRRFLRHLRTHWNTHLHRSCQKSIQLIQRLRDTGRLEQIAARVVAVEKRKSACESAVRLRLRPESLPAIDVDLAVNGTGLFSDIRKTDSELIAQLLSDGIAQPDPFYFGLRVNEKGRLLSAGGSVLPKVFALGTLRRGEELECTAVPEIRRQVAVIVEEIVGRPEPQAPVG